MAKNIIFVFDLDGTLVDTAPALLDAGNHVLGSIGRKPIQIEKYKGFIGGGTKKQVDNLTKINSLSLFHPFPKLNQRLIDRNDDLLERKLDPKKKYLLHFGIIRKYKGLERWNEMKWVDWLNEVTECND